MRSRDFRLLLAANVVSCTGDWILSAGLAYQIYVLTGSTLASAAMVLAALAPQMALGSFAGVLADRWDRRRAMIACNLLLAATLLPLLLVGHSGRTAIVYAVVAVQSALAALFASAEAALVPALVPERDLVTANALNGQLPDLERGVAATDDVEATIALLAAFGSRVKAGVDLSRSRANASACW